MVSNFWEMLKQKIAQSGGGAGPRMPPTTPTPPLLQRNSSGYYAGQPDAARPPRQPFSGADVMQALQSVGTGVQRLGATAREFGIGQGVGPTAGPGTRALILGGAVPTQPAQPYIRRPKWWPQ